MAYLNPEDAPRLAQEYQRSLSDKDVFGLEYRWRKKDGNYLWVHSVGKVRLDETGTPIGLVGILKDIDARKKLEEYLRLIASVIEHSSDGVLITDRGQESWPECNSRGSGDTETVGFLTPARV